MSPNERLLFVLQGLFSFTIGLAGIFVTVFLFKLGGFTAVVTYGLTTFIFLFITYILSGHILKKFSSVDLLRVGLFFLSLLYCLLFILRENSLSFLALLGIINGIGNGNFWSGNNLTQYIETYTHTRHEFFGKLNFFINSGFAAGPILGGAIIALFGLFATKEAGYTVIFLIVSLLFFVLFLFVGKFPKHTGVQFSLIHIVRHKRTLSWNIILLQQFLYGLWDIAFGALSTILIFFIVGGEFSLGLVSTINTVVFAIASFFIGKVLQKYNRSFFVGIIFAPLGLLLFALNQNLLGIISLIIIVGFSQPFLNISSAKSLYDIIDRNEESWQNKYHFLVERDSILGLGRIINYIILLFLFTHGNQTEVAKTWILIIPILPFAIGLLQWYQYNLIKK